MVSLTALGFLVVILQVKNAFPKQTTNLQNIPRVVNANNVLAFSLYKTLSSNQGNIFMSPISLSTALSMLYMGAEDQTEQEMANALGYVKAEVDTSNLHSTYKDLLSFLSTPKDEYTLNIANSMMVQSGFSVLPSYKSDLDKFYDAYFKEVDFISEGDAAKEEINDWVKKKTNGKIPSLLEEPLSSDTRLMLLNAVYFLGNWVSPFDEEYTTPRTFYNNGDENSQSKVDMMLNVEKFPYVHIKHIGLQAVKLPYKGNDVSLLVLLPDKKDGLSTLEEKLDSKDISQIFIGMKETEISLLLPKFKLEHSQEMTDSLKKIGMKNAFESSNADFSGITGAKDLYVSTVVHKAVIEVNEHGSEAAGATGIGVSTRSFKPVFNADHPFMFFIIDENTEMVLFMGRVTQL